MEEKRNNNIDFRMYQFKEKIDSLVEKLNDSGDLDKICDELDLGKNSKPLLMNINYKHRFLSVSFDFKVDFNSNLLNIFNDNFPYFFKFINNYASILKNKIFNKEVKYDYCYDNIFRYINKTLLNEDNVYLYLYPYKDKVIAFHLLDNFIDDEEDEISLNKIDKLYDYFLQYLIVAIDEINDGFKYFYEVLNNENLLDRIPFILMNDLYSYSLNANDRTDIFKTINRSNNIYKFKMNKSINIIADNPTEAKSILMKMITGNLKFENLNANEDFFISDTILEEINED